MFAAAASFAGVGTDKAHAAPRTLATELRGTSVAAQGDMVAWSRYVGGGQFVLVAAKGQQPPARLPVRSRRVAFDVDLGTDARGRTVATYSRCRREPTERRFAPIVNYETASGCDVYLYDFKRRAERRLDLVSRGDATEYLPSASQGRVAFARIFERRPGAAGRLPYLYVAKLSSGRERRVPGGTRGEYFKSVEDAAFDSDAGGFGPLRLDLLGRQLALSWSFVPSDPPPARYGCPEFDRDLYEFPFIYEIREGSITGGTRLIARACDFTALLRDAQALGSGRVSFISTFSLGQCFRTTVTRALADGSSRTLQPLPADSRSGVVSFAQSGDKGFFARFTDSNRIAVVALGGLDFANGTPEPPPEPPCPGTG